MTGGYRLSPVHRFPWFRLNQGYAALAAHLVGAAGASSGPVRVAIDGFSGVLWPLFIAGLTDALRDHGGAAPRFFSTETCFLEEETLQWILHPFLTEDPVFGRLYRGVLANLWDQGAVAELQEQVSAATTEGNDLIIIYGPGAATIAPTELVIYVDVPKDVGQALAAAGAVFTLGSRQRRPFNLTYKQLYFVDWPLLNKQKRRLLPTLDVFIDATDITAPVCVEGTLLRQALQELAGGAFRVKPWFAPGPWGGQWMKETFGLPPEQPNYAWSFELIAPENGLLLGDQQGKMLECSFDLLLWQETSRVLGDRVAARYGSYFPIRFDYLDTMGGANLSCQVHPRVDYIRDEFGEPFTQDESYYIVANQPGARVFLGLHDETDLSAFQDAARAARDLKRPFEIADYVHHLPSHPGDLFLIPSGTVHCSGKDNLVLEISATPYIYTMKIYDYLRADLQGRLRHVHLDRAFANLDPQRRARWVDEHLVAQPHLVREGPGWAEYKLGELDLLFYAVHRLEFAETINDETPSAFVILNLVEGEACAVTVPGREAVELRFAETLIIPASVAHYTLRNCGSTPCKVVKAFVK